MKKITVKAHPSTGFIEVRIHYPTSNYSSYQLVSRREALELCKNLILAAQEMEWGAKNDTAKPTA